MVDDVEEIESSYTTRPEKSTVSANLLPAVSD